MYDLCKKGEKTHFIKNEKKNPSLVALYLVILLNTYKDPLLTLWNIQQRVFYYNSQFTCVPLPHW